MTMTDAEPGTEAVVPTTAWLPPTPGEPPPYQRWPNTLYDVAVLRDIAGRDPVGSMWPAVCDKDYKSYTLDCVAAPVDKTTFLTGEDWSVPLPPEVIYAGDRCAPVGRSEAEAIARAERLLDLVEPYAVAQEVVEPWLIANAPAAPATTSLDMALGLLECRARDSASVGSIMLTPLAATLLSSALERIGDRLFTRLGTPVWLGPCTTGTELGFAMGPIVVERGRVETLVGFNRQRNDRVVIAERVVVVSIGCNTTKVTIPLPT